MRVPIHFILIVLIGLGLASACEPTPASAPAPTNRPPTLTRAPDAPTSTPARVAFPTAIPATIEPTLAVTTTPAAPAPPTATLSAARAASAPPVAQLISPLPNAQVSVSQTFNVVIYATDDNGIARIELTDDGAPVKTETAPTLAPRVFAAIIPWTPAQIGAHTLRAVAYDADNRASAPEEVTLTVIQDARRPTSIIVYPIGTPQVDLGSVFQLSGIATDEVGVTQVDLLVDNQIYAYLTAPNFSTQTLFPFAFTWYALVPGNHTFIVRAHDNQEQTTDSSPLKILVADTHTPAINVTFDRTNAQANETITITVTALDVSGIQRIELLSGKEVFYTVTSANAARQTVLTTQVLWQSPNPGDFSITARAYNANNNSKDTPAQTINILRPNQALPTPPLAPTPTRPRAPRATPTTRAQPPPPPSAEIQSPADRFSGMSPLRITFAGRGNAELERIELWGYYQSQPSPQIICTIDAHATTQKTGQCEWTTPSAGVVALYAQASDIYHQIGRSPIITGTLGIPVLPTATPPPPSIAGKWTSAALTQTLTVNFRQTGATLRGDYKSTSLDTDGRVTSGTVKSDRVTFRVEFAPATPSADTPTPAAMPPALDFDCALDATATMLNCSFRDARNRAGNAVFRRE